MIKKTKSLVFALGLLLFSIPVYSAGYENIERSSQFGQFGRFLLTVIIFIAVIFLTVIGTRIIASNYKGMKNNYVDVYDTLDLPGGFKIVIMEINDKVYILSIGNGNTTVLDMIPKAEFPKKKNDVNENLYDYNINKYVDKIIKKVIKSKEGKDEE